MGMFLLFGAWYLCVDKRNKISNLNDEEHQIQLINKA